MNHDPKWLEASRKNYKRSKIALVIAIIAVIINVTTVTVQLLGFIK